MCYEIKIKALANARAFENSENLELISLHP